MMEHGAFPSAGLLRKYGFMALIWSVLVIGSLLWDMQRESARMLGTVAAAARADIGKDLAFRRWATSHGGVYVTPTEHTPSNPYLNVPDRDVVTTSGKKLTLMNPAYMLREMQTDFPGEFGARSHITSLNLLNPNNAPDAWEREVLQAFDRGEKERVERELIDGQPYLRMMRPLVVEKGCLKCHAAQGYKVGDVRGGLSTAIPLESFIAQEAAQNASQAWTHGAIWLIGLVGLGFSYRRERRQFGERERAEAQLRATSLYTRSLVEASLDPLVTISPEGKITDVNQATEKVTGRSRAELVGTDFSDYFTEPDKARAGYREVFAKGSVTDYPLAIRHKDGRITDVLYNASVYRGERGDVLGVFAAARDVTERNKAEAALRENEALLQATMKILPVGLWVLDANGNIAFSNDAAQRVWAGVRYVGLEQLGEYKGWRLDNGMPLGAHDWAGSRALEKGETTIEEEVEIECFDGTHKIILDSAVPLRGSDGSIRGVVTINHDISERKRAEEALRSSESRYRALIESAPMCIHEIGMDGRISSMNKAGLAMMGVEDECRVQGFLYLDAVCDADRERIGELLNRAYAGEASYFEFTASGPDGLVFKSCFAPIKDQSGRVVKLMGITEDVTERRHAEDALREKEERLALATVHNGVGIWDWNLVTQEMIWDDSMFALYHIRREDFIGTEEAWRASLHPDDLQRGDAEVADAIAGRKPFETEFRVVWPGGEVRYIKAVAKVFRDDKGTPLRMLGINMDVTERRKAEAELRELNNDFVTLLENTSDFIYFKNKDSRIVFCSQTLADITGHASWRDMVGKHDMEIFPPETARIYYEEELPIFREGKPLLNKTDPYYDEQGKKRWVNTNKWPVFGEDGKTVMGIFGISRDITELKEAEDKISELNRGLELRVAERTGQLEAANKELEAFSYSVSHDLRSPLRAIDGFSNILLDEYKDKLDDDGKHMLNVVRENVVRMSHLIDDILHFSRSGRMEMTRGRIDMEALAREVLDELLRNAPQPALQVEIGQLPQALGDRAMLKQVYANLLSNALKFSHNKESPKVEVGSRIEGNDTVYYVKDNGAGFDMQYADHLFGVFQRLHSTSEFEGTGIGLAIVKRIVTRHGGRVWAEGKPGEGAVIYFSLPSAAGEGV